MFIKTPQLKIAIKLMLLGIRAVTFLVDGHDKTTNNKWFQNMIEY